MKVTRIIGFILPAAFSALLASSPCAFARTGGAAAAPAQASKAAPAGNLTKEILEHKDAINWKPAPANAIPSDVCNMFQACDGPVKVVALPAATEGGQKVGRGVFLTEDAKHSEVIILEHQTYADIYFFLLGPDGTLQKAAYREQGKSWVPVGHAVSDPTFEKDKAEWHSWVTKLGGGGAKEVKK